VSIIPYPQPKCKWTEKTGGQLGCPPVQVSINSSAKGFGGKDSVKENRQGCLSRAIKPLFQTFKKFEKVQQPVEKTFSTG
jgi:hypothetical protein